MTAYLKVVGLQHDRPSLPAKVGASGTREERLIAVAVPAADDAGQPAAGRAGHGRQAAEGGDCRPRDHGAARGRGVSRPASAAESPHPPAGLLRLDHGAQPEPEAGPEGRREATAGRRRGAAPSDRSGGRGAYRPRSLPWPARPRRALTYWVHPSAVGLGVTRRCGRP